MKLTIGPVYSRRLGWSLGINNVPHKYCTYSCIYCQAGPTTKLCVERLVFFDWRDLVSQVIRTVELVGRNKINVVTFVPNGEPTLDANLGREIVYLKRNLDIPVAVLTNGSLLFREDVREDLAEADIVSVKVDAVSEQIYKKINRPHPSLSLELVLNGIREFSREFSGRLLTETMLVHSVNDLDEEITRIAKFLSSIRVDVAYIAIPVRPPCEKWVKPVSEDCILRAYRTFSMYLGESKVRLLIELERESPRISALDPVNELLSMLCVHPLKLEYAISFLERAGKQPEETLRSLIERGLIEIVEYRGEKFLVRKIKTS